MLCIGFAGCEAFDVILYMGRTLTKLKYRVLIIDLSDTGALSKAINHGMHLDSSKEIVNYRNINYIRRMPKEEELVIFKEGVILISYGLTNTENTLSCNVMNIVVNTFPHTIDKINTLVLKSELQADQLHLLVRDIISPNDIDRVNEAIEFQYDNKLNYLYLDLSDYSCAVNMQEKQLFKFLRLSSGMKRYIISQIHDIFPNIKLNKINKALTSAGKGR